MLYCQSGTGAHRAPAIYALSFARDCGHDYPARTLACLQHGAEHRAQLRAAEPTACERCGEPSPLTLVRVEDVFEERLVITVVRSSLESSAHSSVTFAYDRAFRLAAEHGLAPVTGYRMPVRWRSATPSHPIGVELMEAAVTMAVTLPDQAVHRAG